MQCPQSLENQLQLLCVITAIIFSVADSEEYCNTENFEAKCATNQIIMMESAQYGRMRKGRCIEGEGQMNCRHDVREILQKYCSGRKTCQMPVSDLSKMREPCPKDYVNYLDATYSCKTVASGDANICISQHYIELRELSGILPSLTHSPSVGVIQCPWFIHASKGQRIQLNITIFNMSDTKGKCPYSVMIQDGEKSVERDTCSYSWGSYHIFTSTSYAIHVYSKQTGTSNVRTPVYIISYQVIGCADLVSPHYSSIKRTHNDLEVRCNKTKETWFRTCKQNKWIGEIGNCTSSGSPKADSVTSSDLSYPQGLIAAVLLGLVLGVIIGFTSLGIYIMHRKRKLQQGAHADHTEGESLHYERKEPQYGEVPLYRDSGSSSTYYTGGASQQYGTTLNRPRIYDPPLGPIQGVEVNRINVSKTFERDVPPQMRRDML